MRAVFQIEPIYASFTRPRNAGRQIERRARRGRKFRGAGKYLAVPLCRRRQRRRSFSGDLHSLRPAAGTAHHGGRILGRTRLAPQCRGSLPGARPQVEFPGLQRRRGGIPDPGLLLRGVGMDRRIHGSLRDGKPRPVHHRRRIQERFREFHPEPVAARALHRAVRAGHALRHRDGRAERHRTLGKGADAPAVRHPDRTVDPLAADARRRGRASVPVPARLLEGDALDGARGAGAGLLLALDRHRHDGSPTPPTSNPTPTCATRRSTSRSSTHW